MSTVWGYGRASTEEQEDTLDNQRDRCEAEFKLRYERDGYTWGGMLLDRGVSGSRPLQNRPEGAKLCANAGPGDIIVILKLDRGFRSARDFFTQLDYWQGKGVRLRLLDLDLDTGTPMGRLLAGMLALVAEFERERMRERIKDINNMKRRQGRPTGAAPYGWRLSGRPGQRALVPDTITRNVASKIVEWHDAGWSFEAIYFHMLKHHIKRLSVRKEGDGTEYSLGAIKRMYHGERALRELERAGVCYPTTIGRHLKEQQQQSKGDQP